MASQLLVHAHRTIGRGLAVVLVGSLVAAGCGSSAGSEGAQQATESSTPTSGTVTTQLDESASTATTPLETSTTVAPTTTAADTTVPVDLPVTSSGLACEPIAEGRDFVEIIPSRQPGAVRDLELTKAQDGTSGTPTSSVTPIRVEMLEDVAGEQRFQWTQGRSDVYMNGALVSPDFLGPTAALMEGSEVRYSISDETGLPVVDNVDELRDRMFDAISSIVERDPEAVAILDRTKATFEGMDDEQLSLVFTEEAQLYHLFDYSWFDEGEVLEVAEELPNLFGGENFPATTTLTVQSFIDEDGCVLIESATRPDPLELRRILVATLTELAGTDSDPAEFEGIQMEMENRVLVQFDATRGLIHSVVATQELTVDEEYRIETVTLVDVTE